MTIFEDCVSKDVKPKDLGPKWVRMTPQITNPGTFKIRFLSLSPIIQKKIHKNPRRVQFAANRTLFGSTLTSPADPPENCHLNVKKFPKT